MPSDFAKSLVDSVLPVGAAPNLICRAPAIVIQNLSINGVITNLDAAPKYSYPYLSTELTCFTTQKSSSI